MSRPMKKNGRLCTTRHPAPLKTRRLLNVPIARHNTSVINAKAVAKTVVRVTPAPTSGGETWSVSNDARNPTVGSINATITGNEV